MLKNILKQQQKKCHPLGNLFRNPFDPENNFTPPPNFLKPIYHSNYLSITN